MPYFKILDIFFVLITYGDIKLCFSIENHPFLLYLNYLAIFQKFEQVHYYRKKLEVNKYGESPKIYNKVNSSVFP